MPMLANVGVPMIFIHWPLMFSALVPVIILEALLIRRWVPLSTREAFIGVGKANVFSTLVGVPLAWLMMLLLEFAVLLPVAFAADKWKIEINSPVLEVLGFLISVAWLVPAEEYLHWMVPVAVGLLLVPCFYVSVFLERRSCLRTWTSADPVRIRQGVFKANLASYALLFVLACGWVTFELATKGAKMQRIRAEPVARRETPPSASVPGTTTNAFPLLQSIAPATNR